MNKFEMMLNIIRNDMIFQHMKYIIYSIIHKIGYNDSNQCAYHRIKNKE